MRTIMARSTHESSLSFSKRHFQWIIGKGGVGEEKKHADGDGEQEFPAFSHSSSRVCDDEAAAAAAAPPPAARKRGAFSAAVAVSRFRSVLTAAIAGRRRPAGLGPRVIGTLFGHRRGHVHFAFQVDPRSCPALLIELATPTSTLVREMASGLVRIALECERRGSGGGRKAAGKLVEEPLWRAYCNGKKCGYAVRRQCGPADWRVLRAVQPVSMGAGVLPGDGGPQGEMMYMRARFERVVGSKDSEALYMMNPDSNGGPELSIYLLRV
ncbi:protein MIZU-KUSSEI 1 [Elaeis guineensis]|uniref:protein MIZU-KUSSEI 1 n=1 Tax=Elaeis guineensis var. tenera TaxID=51953 RepID=UPI003C6D4F88